MEFAKYSLIFKSTKNGCLLINTMTNSVVRFDQEHSLRLANAINGSKDEEIEGFLRSHHFLRDHTFENAFLLDKERALFHGKDLLDVCIFTSLRCNLRCPYCYERHDGPTTGDDTYIRLERKIKELSPQILFISWFGGEPLLNKERVLSFSSEMKEYQNSCSHIFKSGITTNGTLLDGPTSRSLVDCGVTSFQVTVDGPKEMNDISRLRPDGGGTFDIIMRNLLTLHKIPEPFTMIVRCNVSDQAVIDPFCDVFNDNFGNDKRFSLLFYPVSDWKNLGKSCMAKSLNIFSLNEPVLRKGLHSALMDSVNTEGFFCQFGHPGKFVVYPDGSIGDCTIKMMGEGKIEDCLSEDPEARKNCPDDDCLLYPKCFGQQCRNAERGEKICEAMRQGVIGFYQCYAEELLHEKVSLLV